MANRLTLQIDDETFEALEQLADKTKLSMNCIANEALRQYVGSSIIPHPVVSSADDLAGDFWPEDDTDAFLYFLETAREAS